MACRKARLSVVTCPSGISLDCETSYNFHANSHIIRRLLLLSPTRLRTRASRPGSKPSTGGSTIIPATSSLGGPPAAQSAIGTNLGLRGAALNQNLITKMAGRRVHERERFHVHTLSVGLLRGAKYDWVGVDPNTAQLKKPLGEIRTPAK
jgi:hypothetical protein